MEGMECAVDEGSKLGVDPMHCAPESSKSVGRESLRLDPLELVRSLIEKFRDGGFRKLQTPGVICDRE